MTIYNRLQMITFQAEEVQTYDLPLQAFFKTGLMLFVTEVTEPLLKKKGGVLLNLLQKLHPHILSAILVRHSDILKEFHSNYIWHKPFINRRKWRRSWWR